MHKLVRNSRINTHGRMPAKCKGCRQYHLEACNPELRNARLTTVQEGSDQRVGLTESFSEAALRLGQFCILLGAQCCVKPTMLLNDPYKVKENFQMGCKLLDLGNLIEWLKLETVQNQGNLIKSHLGLYFWPPILSRKKRKQTQGR